MRSPPADDDQMNHGMIIVAGSQAQADGVPTRAGWRSIRAVREGSVYAAPRPILLIPGPRIVEGIEFLAHLLHPEIGRAHV